MDKKEEIGDMLTRVAVEELARLEHEQWAHWMEYLKSKSQPFGRQVAQSNEDWERWERQMNTPYKDLTEAEKESDRVWARKVLETLGLSQKEVMKALFAAQIQPITT